MARQLLGITYKNGSVTLDTISYTLNIQGNRTSRNQGTLTENSAYDLLGQLTAASCAVLETYTYDAFGKRTVYNATGLQIPDTAYANTNGYTGREHLPISGLMDYRNRSYSTTLDRFLQTDPIRFNAGDVNLYRYVANSPVNWIDPDGRNPAAALPGIWGGAIIEPTPFGEVAAAAATIGIGGYLLWDWLMNKNTNEENNAVDGEGKACPESELSPTGESKTEESTRKGNKGGTSVQEGYKDSQGRDVTKHTLYGPNGKPVHGPHYRPGGFK